MNSYKLNGVAGHLTRRAIVKGLNIKFSEIYKTVQSVDAGGWIWTKDGKKYELILKEIKHE